MTGQGSVGLASRAASPPDRIERPPCLENPSPARAASTLTENARSPVAAEPGHFHPPREWKVNLALSRDDNTIIQFHRPVSSQSREEATNSVRNWACVPWAGPERPAPSIPIHASNWQTVRRHASLCRSLRRYLSVTTIYFSTTWRNQGQTINVNVCVMLVR